MPELLWGYCGLTVLYALLNTLDFQIKMRLAQQDKIIIKRMVLERVLHSEIGELERLTDAAGHELEAKIVNDISQTMQLVTFTLPTTAGAIYTFMREGNDLYKIRARLDAYVMLRPVLVGAFTQVIDSIKYRAWDKKEKKVMKENNKDVAQLFTGIVEGLHEIQVNNIQQSQLSAHDELSAIELENTQGLNTYVGKVWNTLTSRSLIDFVSEVYVVHGTMERRGITHEEYSRIQSDLEHVVQIGRKIFRSLSTIKTTLKKQGSIIRLLSIPNFIEEKVEMRKRSNNKAVALLPFTGIRVENIQFTYPLLGEPGENEAPNPTALDFEGKIEFKPGRMYAILGQNRSGKTTLLHLICKLQNKTSRGSLSLNNSPYSAIPRVSLRSLIAYISQRPYIFPGTIRENIMVGMPHVTHEDILEAADAAGIFMHENPFVTISGASKGDLHRSNSVAAEGFACQCDRYFNTLGSLLPTPGEKASDGCRWCLQGRLHGVGLPSISPSKNDGRHPFHPILDLETGVRGTPVSFKFSFHLPIFLIIPYLLKAVNFRVGSRNQ